MTQLSTSELAQVLANTLKNYEANVIDSEELKTELFVLSEVLQTKPTSELYIMEDNLRKVYNLCIYGEDIQDSEILYNLNDILQEIGLYHDEIAAYKEYDNPYEDDIDFQTYEDAMLELNKGEY